MSHFQVSILLPAVPARIYHAWLSSPELGSFLGGPAHVDPMPGGSFLARGGEVEGHIFDLKPYRQIVQTWRTQDLPSRCPDSLLALILERFGGGYARLTVEHVQIPQHLAVAYERAWREDYLQRMRGYFAEQLQAQPAMEIPVPQTAYEAWQQYASL